MPLVQPLQPPVQDRKPSPTNPFGSNNPFRSRASHLPTAPLTPTSTNFDRQSVASSNRPKSTNPFLDVFDDGNDPFDSEQPRTLHKSNSFDASSAQRPQLIGATAELFENLTITDHDRELKNAMERSSSRDTTKPGQFPSRPPPPLPTGHRYSKSTETRAPMDTNGAFAPLADKSGHNLRPPPTRDDPRRRPRRNSDSSIMESHDLDKERERERRERKVREARRTKDANVSSSKEDRRPSKSRESRKKSSTPLDMIDKLDVTGIYGSGLFHHDGPFDACNPHRNKNARRAPMQAFPADSANNALTGFGPLPEKADHSNLFGHSGPEAYRDFNMPVRRGSHDDGRRPAAPRADSFNPVQRVDPVHGDESLGLGTSTFLDGAPASKIAIQQSQKEAAKRDAFQNPGGASALGRKKSLSHKIRSLSGSRPRFNTDASSSNRQRGSGDDDYPSPSPRFSPTTTSGLPKKKPEANPFFGDYDSAYDRKGESISAAEVDKRREGVPSSPKKPARVQNQEPPAETAGGSGGTSLLKRVRSLSKPKKRE